MREITNNLAVLAFLTLSYVAQAAKMETENSKQLTLKGPHSSHTKDEKGNFKHPFTNQSDKVDTIIYEDSKTFSTKLTLRPGPSRIES